LAWLRAFKAGPGPAADERLAKLSEYHQALLSFAEGARQEIARTTGVSDFMQAVENALSLSRGQANKKPSEFAALDACRRVLAAFNALVLE
jgi:hypothetical protein